MSGRVDIETLDKIRERIRLCDYLCVAQLYLMDNFFLERELSSDDIKPRLLGHWGTCHGINVAYANLISRFGTDLDFHFILGPGHGFPALNANLFIDGELAKVDPELSFSRAGVMRLCREFSWPDGFPSHASPITPGVITEGGELGYALANSYGLALGHPEKTVAVLIGDGELETATAIDSMNLRNILTASNNGRVLPILHLNGYKISAPSLYARKSKRELHEMVRGFGYTPVEIDGENAEDFQTKLSDNIESPFYILRTKKGYGGPNYYQMSHQIPLKNPKTNSDELEQLESWLRSYRPDELFKEVA